jgi:hypothetical protein
MSSESKANGIIAIVGAAVFAILTLVVPFLKLKGFGFITDSEAGVTSDFFWDKLSTDLGSGVRFETSFETLLNYWELRGTPSEIEILWTITSLWGFVFLGLGIIGSLLVVIQGILKFKDSEGSTLGLLGFIAGFVATAVEYVLFIVTTLLEENLKSGLENLNIILVMSLEGGFENLNLILVIFFIIGWIALFIGYFFTRK